MSVTIVLRGGPGHDNSYELAAVPTTLDWLSGNQTVVYGPSSSTGTTHVFVPMRTIDRATPSATPARAPKKKTAKKTPPPPPTFGIEATS